MVFNLNYDEISQKVELLTQNIHEFKVHDLCINPVLISEKDPLIEIKK